MLIDTSQPAMQNKERSNSLHDQRVHEHFVQRQYKRSKTLTSVDWKLLLAFNPPPGYRARPHFENQSLSGNDVTDERDDKVLSILRNILHDLEQEIREDKKKLKEERKLRREERRQRRHEKQDDMSNNDNRRLFRTATPTPFSPLSTDRQTNVRTHRALSRYASDDLSYVGVSSLSRIEEQAGLKRTGSSIGTDWSRHSREPDDVLEQNIQGKDRAISLNTTDTSIDKDSSNDVNETSFESEGARSPPSSSISRAKTSYVNDGINKNSYVRTLDARRKRLVFKKHMNKLSLPNLSHGATETSCDTSDNKKEEPFSVKALRAGTGDNSSTDHDITMEKGSPNATDYRSRTKSDTHLQCGQSIDLTIGAIANQVPSQSPLSPKPIPPKKPARNKLKTTSSESSLETSSPTISISPTDLWRRDEIYKVSTEIRPRPEMIKARPETKPRPESKPRPETKPRPEIKPKPLFYLGHRGRAPKPGHNRRPDTERSHSGTSGYSTDEHSSKTSDSEEEGCGYDDVTVKNYRDQLNKYFMVLRDGEKMAVMLDEGRASINDVNKGSSLSLTDSLSMSDLAIPDHAGWIIHQSEQRKMWGVVIDMLFCIFDSQENEKPEDVILLPGCNIRPLVYKTAINGLHTRKPAKTITGIAKYQIVIDNASTRQKHLFGLESHVELEQWYNVLKQASTLDPESTNEMASTSRHGSFSSTNDIRSNDFRISKRGYLPSKDSMSRAQKLSGSPLSSPRSESPKPARSESPTPSRSDSPVTTRSESPKSFTSLINGDRCSSPSLYKQNQSSPRNQPVVRHDSRRHSLKDIKKHLRREQDQESNKNQPLKAHHFVPQVSEPIKPIPEKKIRSFGSIENLFKFKKKRKKKNSLSEDSDAGSVISTSSLEQEATSESIDISASSSKLKKTKHLSRSLELNSSDSKKGNNGLVRRASDIKDKVFPKRNSKFKPTLGDISDVTIEGFLYHKHHLKWHKIWCVVCRGSFYGFKTQSPSETASLSVILVNCAVIYVTRKDKRDKHLYVFKLSQEDKKSIYLCSSDYKELQQWLTVLQMESNSVLVNAEELRPFVDNETGSTGSTVSSPSGSVVNSPTSKTRSNEESSSGDSSRSRSKKKKQAPPKPPRHSSCPPSVSREPTYTGSDSSTTDEHGRNGSFSSQSESIGSSYGSQDELPRHDKALVHVWQNDRGYLFNVIRAKLSAHRARKSTDDIYNKDLNGFNNEGLMVVQDASKTQGSRHVRRSRSFNTNPEMSDTDSRHPESPGGSPGQIGSPGGSLRQRHKPLVVKKIPAKDLEDNQTTAGYMEKKSMSTQWIKYWFVLHEGTLFCYLTTDDHLTVDVLNLHGYTVTSLVDQFRGKRFVIQLSHENFTSTYLSLESRDEMDQWCDFLQQATGRPSSTVKEASEGDGNDQGACAGCEENRKEDVGERRKQVKQKLLEEMLRQKHELERKQAERNKKQRSRDTDSPEKLPNNGDFTTDEQRTSDVTRLRQRRLSTQLKVDTIQKQIVKPNHNKKGLFGFGKSKKVDENKNMFLQDQLKELTDKLHKIETDLSHVEHPDNVFETFDMNQNSKTLSLNSSSEAALDRLNRTNEQDNGVNNKRPSSVKSTMQKWTNKTFSKTSTKKRVSSNGKLVQNESNSDLIIKENGGISGYDFIDGHGNLNGLPEFGNDSDSNPEDALSNSVTDLTRPTSDLRLDLDPSYSVQNGVDQSPTSSKYTRSNSRSSNISSLSSPRREINPTVLAEIDAFEELTRQVLGARAKD